MAAKTNKFEFDPSKLVSELSKRGTNHYLVSEEMGHSKNYIKHQIDLNGGHLNKPTVIFLDKFYNIKYDDIKRDLIETTVEEDTTCELNINDETIAQPPTIIDLDKLYSTIYSAVYNAVKNAWMDE